MISLFVASIIMAPPQLVDSLSIYKPDDASGRYARDIDHDETTYSSYLMGYFGPDRTFYEDESNTVSKKWR
jgi:hypothetical protein